VLATLLALVAAVAAWASSLDDSERFAERATEALQEEEVSALVAGRLVDRFAGDTVIGTSGRPAAVSLTEGVLQSEEFGAVFQAAVRTAHEQLVSDRDDSVTVALAGAAPLLDPAIDPDDTSAPPSEASSAVAVVDNPTLVRVAHVLSLMDTVALLCAAGWLLASAAALVIASDRRRVLRRLGSGLLVAGAVLIGAVLAGRYVVGQGDPADVHAATAAVVTVFTDPLLRLAEVLAVVGAVVAVCALSTPPTPGQLYLVVTDRAAAVWRVRVVRVASPVLVLLAGLTLLLAPAESVVFLAQVAGVTLVVAGSVVLAGWLGRALDRGRPDPELPGAVRTLGTSALTAVVVVGVVAVVVVGAFAPRGEGTDLPSADPDGTGCNGLVGLCDLPLTEVALPGTHNSMSSSAEPGWYLGEQRLTISGQLAAGARSLLVDVYPGYVSGGRVRTDLRAPATAEGAADDVTEEQQAALENLGLTIGAVPPEGADIEAYLCHAYCELGASKMVDRLRDVGDFLAHNPNEVLVLILQDYIDGEQTQEVFEEAGLMDRVWPLTKDGPWPTLRQMVLRQRNIVVLSENHGDETDWMPAAYEVTEETPYEFETPDDFTCEPNRGGTGKPFFLLNHWVRTPGSSPLDDAKIVNTRAALEDRLAECERERGRRPGILAVNFIDVGDTFGVVDDLNRSLVPD
jgi:hypothetical protein